MYVPHLFFLVDVRPTITVSQDVDGNIQGLGDVKSPVSSLQISIRQCNIEGTTLSKLVSYKVVDNLA